MRLQLRWIDNGLLVPLYAGRLGMRVHIGSYNLARVGSPKYALCGVSRAFKTRPNAEYSVHPDRMCPKCLKRALARKEVESIEE